MRNRGVEINLADDSNVDGADLDISALVRDQDQDGIVDAADREAMVSAHRELLRLGNFHLGNLTAAAFWTMAYLRQDQNLGTEAVVRAFHLTYGRDVCIQW